MIHLRNCMTFAEMAERAQSKLNTNGSTKDRSPFNITGILIVQMYIQIYMRIEPIHSVAFVQRF